MELRQNHRAKPSHNNTTEFSNYIKEIPRDNLKRPKHLDQIINDMQS